MLMNWKTPGVAFVSVVVAACGGLVGCSAEPTVSAGGAEVKAEEVPMASAEDGSLLGFEVVRLDGEAQALSAYRGKVVVVVNTASRCGLTPQYEGLEAMYREKKGEGLVVLGFPANDFAGQEPLSNGEIASFCEQNYGVSFPMFEKVAVLGEGAHPLFAALTEKSEAPSWNFTKYLIGRDGALIARFDPRTTPSDAEFVAAVDAALAEGAAG